MYVLFTDTDTDIIPSQAKELGYHLISMPYNIDGNDIYPYEDFEEFDYHSFYDLLRKGTLPKTSAISPLRYINYIEPHFKNGHDILYVHFSKNMSGTFQSLALALEELKEKYPERKFHMIDTKGITICSLNIVLEIGKLYKEGKSIEEITKWAEEEVDKYATYFYADDLKFFGKSGRVSALTATMGNLFHIHPIIHMNGEGKMISVGKEKGKVNSLKKLVSIMKEIGDDVPGHRIIIGHSDALEIAQQLERLIKAEFGDNLNIVYAVVNPTAGSHCGPNTIGVSFHAKHR